MARREDCPSRLAPPWLPLRATLDEALRGSLSSGPHGAEDPLLVKLLRMTGQRALETQRDACYSILEEVERLEAAARHKKRTKKRKANSEAEEGGVLQQPEGQADVAAEGQTGKVVGMRSAYRAAWRLDHIGRSHARGKRVQEEE